MKKFSVLLCAIVLVAVFLIPARNVQAIYIENASFEAITLDDYGVADYIPFWGISASTLAGTFNPTVDTSGTWTSPPSFTEPVPDRDNVAFINNEGFIGQWLEATLREGYRYIFEVYMGFRADLPSAFPSEQTYGLRLIEATTEDKSGWHILREIHGVTPLAGTFDLATLIYDASTAGTGFALGINLMAGGGQVNFDDVRLDESVIPDPVPEPATMLLVGSGLIGLAAIGRKKFFKKT